MALRDLIMNESIDLVRLNFSPESLRILNICLGFIMFSVALALKPEHFRQLFKTPRSVLTGVFSQFLLLPLATFGLILALQPMPSIALGMILVAACPGGNISNFISLLAGGNAALSVSLTAISTLLAIVLTPLNFMFWASLLPETGALLTDIKLDVWEMCKTVILLLGIPLVLGMFVAHRFPAFTKKITKPSRILSLLIFAGFLVVAFTNNFDAFKKYIGVIVGLVLLHNALALATGYLFARSMRLDEADRRALSIETGIQNSGLGLLLIFSFFDGLGGMAIVAAWWGIWHIIAGLTIAGIWGKLLPLREE